MALPKISKSVRLNVASDLTKFATVLSRYGFDTTRIYEGINTLKNESYIPSIKVKNKYNSWEDKRDESVWEYEIPNMVIVLNDIKEFKHLKPDGFKSLALSLSVLCKASCNDWGRDERNPFIEASVTIKISGSKEASSFQSGFHFDLSKPSEFLSQDIHPSYHLQYSPNISKIKEFNHGNIILTDIPRAVHPPLDFILGFDYILSNFAPKRHEKLLEDRTYTNLVREYQRKIWMPYYKRISNFWETPREEKEQDDLWHPQNLLPHLIDR